jgi:uncharacterized protein YcfJ
MLKQKRILLAVMGLSLFAAHGCGEGDDIKVSKKEATKVGATIVGALGGAYVGNQVAGGDSMLGSVVGGVAGGVLGNMAGSAITK